MRGLSDLISPIPRAIALAVWGVVARDHDDPDARLPAFTKGFWHFGSRRVFQADEASEDEVLFEMFVLPLGLEQSIRQGNDSQTLFGHGFLSFKNPLKHPAAERDDLAVCQKPAAKGKYGFGRALAKRSRTLWKFMYQSEPQTVGVKGNLVQLRIGRHCGQGLLRADRLKKTLGPVLAMLPPCCNVDAKRLGQLRKVAPLSVRRRDACLFTASCDCENLVKNFSHAQKNMTRIVVGSGNEFGTKLARQIRSLA
jgi:hypothetical protein